MSRSEQTESPSSYQTTGLNIESEFCPSDVASPWETVEWEARSATIKNDAGGLLFEQTGCRMPKAWSHLATNVVVSKYFYGESDTPQRETSLQQLIQRVTRTIADWGLADGYFATTADGERFYRDLSWLCLHQFGAFNSPVWFNVGLNESYQIVGDPTHWRWNSHLQQAEISANPYQYPQCSACFIQSVDDNLEAIMSLATSEARLFKYGSGTGTDLSSIRSHREKLAGGGHPSGPLSFMRVFDQIAGVVKSGGKTRRAAKMQSLKVSHPDILEFIECKSKEEQKARVLIEKGGYDPSFNGEAYQSVMFQNANLSVRVSDEFMRAVQDDQPWTTHWVTDWQMDGPTYCARELFQKMAEGTWLCGDPGIQYDSIINRWHTCPESGRINASNPCSEYMFLDNTACNLASINLMKFRLVDGNFDVKRFTAACRLFFIAQDILIDRSSYPTPAIAENSHRFRPLGLGFSNLGSLLMANGLPYDSAAARGWCGLLSALMTGAAYRCSAELAANAGAFTEFERNRDAMLAVMNQHRSAIRQIDHSVDGSLRAAAEELWDDVVRMGQAFGYRNAQATVLAPTGTISFMMDCDTTGIEPDIALVKYKHLAGGGLMKIVNQTVPLALKTLGYGAEAIASIINHIDQNDTLEGATELLDQHLAVFDCAFQPANGSRSIDWRAHLRMMAAAQPFLSGAISKTVNMPRSATVEDIMAAYQWAWELGIKAVAIYRDGSKSSQPLSTSIDPREEENPLPPQPRRERLPDTRQSITHKFSIAGHEGYLTVGLYDDGRPGEVFITMAKEGSTVGGLMDSFGTAISIALQYGVPLETLVQKFIHARFEPQGFTSNPEIRIAKSLVDYIFRWLGMKFLSDYKQKFGQQDVPAADYFDDPGESVPADSVATNKNKLDNRKQGKRSTSNQQPDFSRYQSDAPSCDRCGSITVRSGNCYLCYHCGNSLGCS
jgi:ribonucleoside-diphosphate reductase alpha chain